MAIPMVVTKHRSLESIDLRRTLSFSRAFICHPSNCVALTAFEENTATGYERVVYELM